VALAVVGILVKAMSKVWRFTSLILPEVKVGREILAHAWATYKSWRKRLRLFIQSNIYICKQPKTRWQEGMSLLTMHSQPRRFIDSNKVICTKKSKQVCCQFVPKYSRNWFICSLTILVQHHAAFCCQRCFPAWLRGCIPERHMPMQSMATVEDHSESQRLEHLTNVAESDFHRTDRNWLHKVTAQVHAW